MASDSGPARLTNTKQDATPSADSAGSFASSALARLAVWLVRQYQTWLSPILGGGCRFYPSCSEFCILAMQKYGFWVGSWRTLLRLCRCHPLHPGGVDFP